MLRPLQDSSTLAGRAQRRAKPHRAQYRGLGNTCCVRPLDGVHGFAVGKHGARLDALARKHCRANLLPHFNIVHAGTHAQEAKVERGALGGHGLLPCIVKQQQLAGRPAAPPRRGLHKVNHAGQEVPPEIGPRKNNRARREQHHSCGNNVSLRSTRQRRGSSTNQTQRLERRTAQRQLLRASCLLSPDPKPTVGLSPRHPAVAAALSGARRAANSK